MTPERIRRHDDEHLHQPRIHSRPIRDLHRISEETGEPMTVLVDHAIGEFVERRTDEARWRERQHLGRSQSQPLIHRSMLLVSYPQVIGCLLEVAAEDAQI